MEEFHRRLDPSETMTIRRILTPDCVPMKGKNVYRFEPWFKPFLEDHGWEFVGVNSRDRCKAYFRSPKGEVAKHFMIDAAIPNDEAILRLAREAMEWCAGEGHFLKQYYKGSIGRYRAEYYPNGERSLGGNAGAEEKMRDRAPTLYVGVVGIWSTRVHWLEGLDRPPSWDRGEYFSALVPGVPYLACLIERKHQEESGSADDDGQRPPRPRKES